MTVKACRDIDDNESQEEKQKIKIKLKYEVTSDTSGETGILISTIEQ